MGTRPRRLRTRSPALSSPALDGRTAIVAGAGPGIGQACAAALRQAGADVVVAARDTERLDALAARLRTAPGGKVVAHVLDTGDTGSCRTLVDDVLADLGRVDVLVNVATFGGDEATVDEADWESWRRAFEVNVIGTLELSRLAARAMSRLDDGEGDGSIIQIGTLGTHALPAGRARYTATKQAMVAAS
ncbi:MAG TPA: SDR family NAD(P)-dependent oxidoreductase, partial [Acidimicrobiales bacterium]|nr:SDR family NAD(P)-dependent oxidoreductase [Acidimicrobiales bacterium]